MGDSRLYPQGKGGIKSHYANGVLKFYNAAGDLLYSIDPVAKTFSYESGVTIAVGADQLAPGTALAPVAGKCTIYSDNTFGPIHQTKLALTLTGANDFDAGNADHGGGVKIADFPAGRILIHGVTVAGLASTNDAFEANPNDTYYLACGSVIAADDADLTGTEADLSAKATIDSVGNTALVDVPWTTPLAASAQFATGLDLNVNFAVAGNSLTKALTIAVTGYITVTWTNLG
jgi:hypothetical protein